MADAVAKGRVGVEAQEVVPSASGISERLMGGL